MEVPAKIDAVIFGSSGLTGRFLTEFLIKDSRYNRLTLVVRKKTNRVHEKIREVVFNPEKPDEAFNELSGDQLFCCLGTTLKKAGTRESFFKTDHHLIVAIAKAALNRGIPVFSFISSIGADPLSRNYYLNTKGTTEDVLKSMGFKHLVLLRPSLLLGIRPERRPMEEAAKVMFGILRFLMIGKFRKYRPIHAETVARAMIAAANNLHGISILESDAIEKTADQITTH